MGRQGPRLPRVVLEDSFTIVDMATMSEDFVPLGVAMDRHDWGRLNHLQLGRYAEYLAKMEFTLYGFDVYTSEVDDRGIDFVIRRDSNRYYDVQVKSVRGCNYIFFPKATFDLRANLLAAIVRFVDGELPELYLIPSTAWREPSALLVSHDYEGKRSKPEWGLTCRRRTYRCWSGSCFLQRSKASRRASDWRQLVDRSVGRHPDAVREGEVAGHSVEDHCQAPLYCSIRAAA